MSSGNPSNPMKKLIRSHGGASKGAALIIVLGLVVFATVLSPANLSSATVSDLKQEMAASHIPNPPRSPTPTPTASPSPTPTPTPTVTPDPGCNSISSAAIASPGSLYKVGDILDPLSGNLCSSAAENYGFRLRVASVNGSGGVTGVTIIPGIGYSGTPSNPVRFGGSPTGTGFTANCTFQ